MRTISGNLRGPVVVEEDTILCGNVNGDIIVRPGRRFEMRGNLMGDILLEGDAEADVRGNMVGQVRHVANAPSA